MPIEPNLPAASVAWGASSLVSFTSWVLSRFISGARASRSTAAAAPPCETSSALLPMVLRENDLGKRLKLKNEEEEEKRKKDSKRRQGNAHGGNRHALPRVSAVDTLT